MSKKIDFSERVGKVMLATVLAPVLFVVLVVVALMVGLLAILMLGLPIFAFLSPDKFKITTKGNGSV